MIIFKMLQLLSFIAIGIIGVAGSVLQPQTVNTMDLYKTLAGIGIYNMIFWVIEVGNFDYIRRR